MTSLTGWLLSKEQHRTYTEAAFVVEGTPQPVIDKTTILLQHTQAHSCYLSGHHLSFHLAQNISWSTGSLLPADIL